jgi:sugar/nucleoside kinase (ribokinase family)
MMTILGIGTVVVDHVVELPAFPAGDTKVEIVNDFRQVGGPVPVALSTAAFYGSATSFFGRWGNDERGIFIADTLRGRGVDTSGCAASGQWSTGFAHVWVDGVTGSRTIAYSRGQFPIPDVDDIDKEQLSGISILHLDGWASGAAIKAAATVKANGGRVVLDAGSVKPGMDQLLPLVDVLIASRLFRRDYFGIENVDAAQMLSLGPQQIIMTDGAAGATWITADDRHHEPAVDIQPVDTNGAGDVFSGCILHAIAQKWSQEAALRFACRVAGYACSQRGNHSLPSGP